MKRNTLANPLIAEIQQALKGTLHPAGIAAAIILNDLREAAACRGSCAWEVIEAAVHYVRSRVPAGPLEELRAELRKNRSPGPEPTPPFPSLIRESHPDAFTAGATNTAKEASSPITGTQGAVRPGQFKS